VRVADPLRRGVALIRRVLAAHGKVLNGEAGCGAVADGSPKEDLTRIGEIHVGSTNGLSMQWNYYSTSDTTLTVGLSPSSDTGPWSASGSYTTTNSLGSGGGFLSGRKTLVYSDGDMWYQRYKWTGGAPLCAHWTNQVVSALGDSDRGSNSPPRNPYCGCAKR
jgi:hypothetical protein